MNIVFLHGIAGSSRSFLKLIPEIDIPGIQFLLFDLLGFGKNRDKGDEYTAEEHLDFVSKRIEERYGKEKVTLVGHSAGGILALLWGSKNPDRVEKIVLVNTLFGKSEGDIRAALAKRHWGWDYLILKHPEGARLLCILLCKMNLMRFLRFLKPKWIPEEVFMDYRLHSWKSLEGTFTSIILNTPAMPLLEKLCDVLVLNITGSKDCEIAMRVPSGQNVSNIMLRGGHWMIFSQGTMIGKLITDFLNRA